jgi:hypothetical protein
MRPPPRLDRADALLEELAAVYRDADGLFAGWSCPASTECCRFGITGREPYVTSIELDVVERAIAARGGPRSWKRSLPIAMGTAERVCPMLTIDGRCAVYAARPLGCRTFFCDRASAAGRVRHAAIGALVRRVQDIAARHRPEGDRGRPLTRAIPR